MITELEPNKPKITPLDKLILKIIQFQNPDSISMSLRNIQAKLEEFVSVYPDIFGDNHKVPSVSTIRKRINYLKESNVILYPTTVIDCSKLSYREMVLIFLKVKFSRPIQEILDELSQIPSINVVYQISGEFPIYCMSKCGNKNHQIAVIERIKKIEGVEDLKTNIVMQKVKEDFRVRIDL